MTIQTGPGVLTPDYVKGSDWIATNYSQLVEQFPNQWIGVHLDHVFAADDELGKVAGKAPAAVPVEDIVFQFLDDGTLIFQIEFA